MSANEFEKRVQHQLDDFQLNPSASVWKKVEEEIRKKKRRRVVFFLLLPALLGLLGYSVYHFLNTDQKAEQVQQPVNAKNEKPLTGTESNASIETKQQPGTPKQETGDQIQGPAKETTLKQKTAATERNELEISSSDPSTARRKNKTTIKQDTKTGVIQKETEFSPIANKKVQAKPEIDITIDKPATGIIAKNEKANDPVQKINDQKEETAVTAKETTSTKTDSAAMESAVVAKETIVQKKAGKPKIKWGIDFSAGITANRNGVFSLIKSSSADALYNSPATNATAGSYAGGPTAPPSSIKPGPSFSIGVAGELKVSGRSRFSAGLQYTYAGNRIRIGSEIDTSALRLQSNNNAGLDAEKVYRGPQKNDYLNNYHFVSIPVAYHWQINKSKKLPVQWNVGLTFGYLLGTNALVYSSSYGGIYYHDKDAINKAHLSIGTGLSFRLKGKKGMEWVLGPQVSFDTRRLVNNGYGKNQYLLFGGINTKLFLPQKKNN